MTITFAIPFSFVGASSMKLVCYVPAKGVSWQVGGNLGTLVLEHCLPESTLFAQICKPQCLSERRYKKRKEKQNECDPVDEGGYLNHLNGIPCVKITGLAALI